MSIGFRTRYDIPDITNELAKHYIDLYKLNTNPIPENWNRSEADVVLRYFFDLELDVSDFDKKDVIDIGCGPGFLKTNIQRLCFPKTFINYDNKKISAKAPDVVACATNMPFRDNSFDLVMAFGSIAGVYWKDLPQCDSLGVFPFDPLLEVARILRKGGVAKVGPISLLRSCWRSENDGAKYETVRYKFVDFALLLKEKFPSLEIEFYRIVDDVTERFDEWIKFRKL